MVDTLIHEIYVANLCITECYVHIINVYDTISIFLYHAH